MIPNRCHDGRLPAYSPGGVPLYYVSDSGIIVCPECVNGFNGKEFQIGGYKCQVRGEDGQWDPDYWIIDAELFEFGHPVVCEECGRRIESAEGPCVEYTEECDESSESDEIQS